MFYPDNRRVPHYRSPLAWVHVLWRAHLPHPDYFLWVTAVCIGAAAAVAAAIVSHHKGQPLTWVLVVAACVLSIQAVRTVGQTALLCHRLSRAQDQNEIDFHLKFSSPTVKYARKAGIDAADYSRWARLYPDGVSLILLTRAVQSGLTYDYAHAFTSLNWEQPATLRDTVNAQAIGVSYQALVDWHDSPWTLSAESVLGMSAGITPQEWRWWESVFFSSSSRYQSVAVTHIGRELMCARVSPDEIKHGLRHHDGPFGLTDYCHLVDRIRYILQYGLSVKLPGKRIASHREILLLAVEWASAVSGQPRLCRSAIDPTADDIVPWHHEFGSSAPLIAAHFVSLREAREVLASDPQILERLRLLKVLSL